MKIPRSILDFRSGAAASILLVLRSSRVLQHQLSVADRNAVTGIVIHFDGPFLIAESIPYRIPNLFLRFIVDSLTPRLRRRVGVFILHVLFKSIAPIAARGRAGDRGTIPPPATA